MFKSAHCIFQLTSFPKNMKKLMFVLLLVLTLFESGSAVFSLSQLDHLTASQLDEDDLVQVVQTSSTRSTTKLPKNYYIIKVIKKDKKECYYKIKQLYDFAVKILIQNKMIPQEDQLVKSKIKPQYLSKKRSWLFSIIFAIIGNEKELELTYNKLSRLGIQRLNTNPSINFLNDKIVAIQVFNSAKAKLTQKLETIGDFEIKYVKEIDIKGKSVENSQIIEEQLEEEFNQSEQIIEENDLFQAQSSSTTQNSELQMTVTFRVGRKSQNVSDDDDDYVDDEEESEQSQSQ